MNNTPTVMLFIDADNVSASVIEQAIARVLADHGAIHVRRAHCTAEAAVNHQQLFKRLSIRPIVNLATGKNSTDIALAVDAIDLVAAERPQVVVIVSSDSDFAPLVIRLREKGCRVLGIGQMGKTGDESRGVYDGFVDLEHVKARPTARSAPAKAAAPRTRAQPVRSRALAPVAPPPAAPKVVVPAEVLSILQAVPALQGGAPMQLNEAGEGLRRHGLLKSKSASPSRFLKRLAAHFELVPADKPRTVRYLGPTNL
ncbi:MAG: NYN domain-containing protein [Burkholderiaceae bacterium]